MLDKYDYTITKDEYENSIQIQTKEDSKLSEAIVNVADVLDLFQLDYQTDFDLHTFNIHYYSLYFNSSTYLDWAVYLIEKYMNNMITLLKSEELVYNG